MDYLIAIVDWSNFRSPPLPEQIIVISVVYLFYSLLETGKGTQKGNSVGLDLEIKCLDVAAQPPAFTIHRSIHLPD